MIDPSAFIAPGAVVLGDVYIGKDASVWYNTVIRGDTERIEVGEGTNIQDLSMVHADPGVPCVVGRRVTVGHRAILHGCIVEDDCLIGMGAILLNGVRVGAGSVIGAGAVLVEGTEVPPGSWCWACPARSCARWTRRCGGGSTTPGGITWRRPGGIGPATSRSPRRRCRADSPRDDGPPPGDN